MVASVSLLSISSTSTNISLETASKLPSVGMNYQNYNSQIIQRLGVKLVGWTHHEVVSPYEITGVDDLRTLRDALVCGACFWMRLSKGELARHKADLEKREAAGEVVTKKRKERSDKGMPKGPRKRVCAQLSDEEEGEDEAGAGPSKRRKGKENVDVVKKRKARARAQLPPSKELLSDTDLDDI